MDKLEIFGIKTRSEDKNTKLQGITIQSGKTAGFQSTYV